MSERCARCGEVGEDRRTLWMACLYAMEELPIPFEERDGGGHSYYTLCVCKACRADWMDAIRRWYQDKPARVSCGSGLFVRRGGATVEITREEWDATHPGREPLVVPPAGAAR